MVFVCRCIAGNYSALKRGGLSHIDVIAALARRQARLIDHGLIIAVHFATSDIGGARNSGAYTERWNTDARAHATAGLLVLLAGFVLTRGHVQIASDISLDGIRPHLSTSQRSILTAFEHQKPSIDRTVHLADCMAFTHALGNLCTEVEGETKLLTDIKTGTNTGLVAITLVVPIFPLLGAFQGDAILRH